MDAVVPAGAAVCERAADRPRAARIVRPGLGRVVRPLAEARADRVDRRQVDDVETHLGDRRQAFRGGAEGARGPGAVLRLLRPLGAREELVPGADRGPRPLDAQHLRLRLGDERQQRGCRDRLGQAAVVRDLEACGRGEARVAERPRGVGEHFGCGALRGAPPEHLDAHREDQVEILVGSDLDLGGVQPGRPVVGARSHAPGPDAGCGDLHLGPHPVGARRGLGHDVAGDGARGVGQLEVDVEHVVALAEHRRLERHDFADVGVGHPQVLALPGAQVADRDATQLARDSNGGVGDHSLNGTAFTFPLVEERAAQRLAAPQPTVGRETCP